MLSYPSSDGLEGVYVLVVDDDDDARELSAIVLRSVGARVALAASADEALGVFVAERPDVLVSDIGMPIRDGYSLIRQVRTLGVDAGGHLPALALTAFVGAEHRALALEAGFTRHEPKPVHPDRLIELVCQLAALRQAS